MATIKAKITKQRISTLQKGDILWDSDIAGFCARRQVNAIVYGLKKRINGTQRWLTIGKHGEPWTPETAKDKAKILLGLIADNKDPAQMRDDLKDRPTVKELCNRFIEEYAREHKKAASINLDLMNINNHILPLLGDKFVADVSLSDIDAFKRSVRAGKTARGIEEGKTKGSPVTGGEGAANRCLSLLSTIFNLAIKWGLRTGNPVSHVDKYKERKIERYLSEIEFSALADAIGQFSEINSNPYPIAAIKLLIFTGARRNEILTLKWSNVDLVLGVISLPDSKTGAKPIYLNAPAKEVLSNLPKQTGNPYVICGALKQAHLVNLRKPWLRLRALATIILWQQNDNINQFVKNHKAENSKYPSVDEVRAFANKQQLELNTGLLDMRLHDLRHSFASVATMGGLSLPILGKLLGHTQSSTTDRYAHLADDPLKAANEAVGNRIKVLMKNNPDNVVSIREK